MITSDPLAPQGTGSDPLGLGFRPLAPQQQGGGDMFENAMAEYPILRQAHDRGDLFFKFTPRQGQTGLETWPPGEEGTRDSPRPNEFPIDKHGIEVYREDVPSIGILGDAVSHMLMKSDPTLQPAYRDFESSLTPHQLRILRNEYDWTITHGDDPNRPYEDWYEHSGLPAMFRGYLFKQWQPLPGQLQATIGGQPIYTPGQLRQFDELRKYLGIQPGTIPETAEGEL